MTSTQAAADVDDDIEPYCQECHSPVLVEPGDDWADGDMCWRCSADKYPEVLARAEYAEGLLKEIDLLCAPNRQGHRRRDALDKIQDKVMMRKFQ